ncbi:hypothetical protein GFS31_32210 [Leptolyngbya sp. BL0902]|uniref:hypothetical protein n=1 Tax=Leptolyngbya sp. BL0902 TaxID=1115757 RepID=UPI001935341E|nr:hypothetical protein [Leptolyngbya sp. BL0902]QQE66523.1 hypothetical protein GFS31_32210 [Leptolyngbya sp. BL0902]
MGLFTRPVWLNFLSLLPATTLAVLTLAIAFLRFYDVQDFPLLGFIANPRLWSNRFTVAALLATLANFGVEWNRRNRETNRLAEARQREAEARQREAEAREREARRDLETARRDRLQVRCLAAQVRYQLDPTDDHRRELALALAQLEEYQQVLDREPE